MKIDEMTEEEARKYVRYHLHTYECLQADIGLERELIRDFRAMQIDSTAKASLGMRVQGGQQRNMLEEIATERLEILRRHESRLAELLIVYGGIQTYRNSLLEGELNWCILKYRYFEKVRGQGNTWGHVRKRLEKYKFFYEEKSLRNRDIEIINDIVKRCVFRQKK